MNKGNICQLCLVVFVASFGFQQAFAHGGGLNSEGCHNNRKTGDYHCHRGPADKPSAPTVHWSSSIANPAEKSERPMIGYNRDLYSYESYPTGTTRGFYTGLNCDTNIDHVVSLKDAHYSGAGHWSVSKRIAFANDKLNHVPSCSRINSSKGASLPSDFFRKSSDGEGMEYEIKTKCAYLGIYYQVKRKYGLSFEKNSELLFSRCGLSIK